MRRNIFNLQVAAAIAGIFSAGTAMRSVPAPEHWGNQIPARRRRAGRIRGRKGKTESASAERIKKARRKMAKKSRMINRRKAR